MFQAIKKSLAGRTPQKARELEELSSERRHLIIDTPKEKNSSHFLTHVSITG